MRGLELSHVFILALYSSAEMLVGDSSFGEIFEGHADGGYGMHSNCGESRVGRYQKSWMNINTHV